MVVWFLLWEGSATLEFRGNPNAEVTYCVIGCDGNTLQNTTVEAGFDADGCPIDENETVDICGEITLDALMDTLN